MSNVRYCYINENFYVDYPNLQKILDINDSVKQNIRTHMCLNIKFNGHNVLIPLRKNLGDPDRRFGKIGYAVPSESKPKAGLDYRHIMIITKSKYITFDTPKISRRQLRTIESNYSVIEREACEYIRSYIRVANKGRIERTARFRDSSLINFHKELHIVPKDTK